MKARCVSRLCGFWRNWGPAPRLKRRPINSPAVNAIARALANDPLIILADEPTGNLDTKNGRIVFDIFKRLVEVNGQAVITVTYDPQLSALTQRQIRLVDGQIVAQ